jgi:DNA-binding MarR family transcriptional regulator
MDPIKEAFSKIKQDILTIKDEILKLKSQITQIQTNPTQNLSYSSQQTDRQTNRHWTPLQDSSFLPENNPPCPQNNEFSIGNRGVPTDRQTNQQTDRQTNIYSQNNENLAFKQANKILASLDSIKKEIRLKFKRLTPQEMLVFSILYTLDEQKNPKITYKTLADHLNLSQSSIRDYINKLIQKGVPVDKIRQNNKTILLKISQDLKNLATLATIQNLREL